MLVQSFLGNTLLAWSVAAGAALLIAAMLLAVRRQGLRWLAARNAIDRPRAFGGLLSAFEATRPWFLIAMALFVGAQFVTLPPKADRVVDHLAVVAVIAQVALWASMAIRRSLARHVA